MTSNRAAIDAQADLHHQYFLGLQLMVAVEESKQAVYDWMFRLFRRQHEEKFISSFEKLDLGQLPHAIACAKYHVLSNNIGGVGVEYMEETTQKAWVRFRYPRWMYAGPAICGIPSEAGRGFLYGWYAQNGVSLGNPRLGFVCVSEDVTGQYGLCGYFKEYDRDLSDKERLVFAPDERPPAFDSSVQPQPPAGNWNEERLAKANRNYAMEYVRNGMSALSDTLGRERALAHGIKAARLTGLQTYAAMAKRLGAVDGTAEDAANFLQQVFLGMGDECERAARADGAITLKQTGLRIVRGIHKDARADLLACWIELFKGAVSAHRAFIDVRTHVAADHVTWTLSDRFT